VYARSIDANVVGAGVEIVTLDWQNLATLARNARLRAAEIGEWASFVCASSIEAKILCARVGIITVLDADVETTRCGS